MEEYTSHIKGAKYILMSLFLNQMVVKYIVIDENKG
nr:MAG TPA: hypothetical protein [Caudoviricetes sp.]